jgi:hypothetical protein
VSELRYAWSSRDMWRDRALRAEAEWDRLRAALKKIAPEHGHEGDASCCGVAVQYETWAREALSPPRRDEPVMSDLSIDQHKLYDN